MLCENCGLAQLRDLIDPQELFTDYVYFSSNSDTMLASAAELTTKIQETLDEINPLVIEIASNDGYLLKNYVAHNIPVLGIDPAQNIAKVANENGIPTICDFFSESLAQALAKENVQADVIHANNVMAHVPDINGFIKGLKILLRDDGYAVIEVPYFADLIEKLEFDTIYHEHVYYFAVKPLKSAFDRHGLEIFTIEKLSIHGGSLRLFVGHQGAHSVEPIVGQMLQEEAAKGIFTKNRYQDFMSNLLQLKNRLTLVLQEYKQAGKKIAAYGASAKGTTLLNFFDIGKDYLDFVVDRSTTKQGCYTPGTHLLIQHPQALLEQKIDYALLLVWNFAEEIIAQQQDFIRQSGQFIVPLPDVRVLS
jgi:SAM-dependent methyltransferase